MGHGGYVVAAWFFTGGLLAAYGLSIALRRRAAAAEAAEVEAERRAAGPGRSDRRDDADSPAR